MSGYTYKLGRLTYYQEELTWGQDKELARILQESTNKVSGDEELSMNGLLDLLVRYDLLGTFLAIVLKPKRNFQYYLWRSFDAVCWALQIRRGSFRYVSANKASNSLLSEIIRDFFLLNKNVMSSLSNYGSGLELIQMAAQKMELSESLSSLMTEPANES